MTHAYLIDDSPHSSTKGQEIFLPCTIIETPDMLVFGARAYAKTPYGLKISSQTVAPSPSKFLSQIIKIKKSDPKFFETAKTAHSIRLLAHTQPDKITGTPRKLPHIMELQLAGPIEEQIKLAQEKLGKTLSINDAFQNGELLDASAVTKGYGMQGPVKRWGVKIQKRANRHLKARHIGTLGGRGSAVKWTIPMAGQTGYHTRTEYNKRILRIGTPDQKITPDGGFPNYGEVHSSYLLVQGTIPGPSKRLIRMRHAIRPERDFKVQEAQLSYISMKSKQGA